MQHCVGFPVWCCEIESQQLYQQHNVLYLKMAWYSGIESIADLVAAVGGHHSINTSINLREEKPPVSAKLVLLYVLTPLLHPFITRSI